MANPLFTILITGANGQLGKVFQGLANLHPEWHFLFADKNELPINDQSAVAHYFETHAIDCCINCAAYTAVDRAESEADKAMEINQTGAAVLASFCKQYDITLFHISTDYVFDGSNPNGYREIDETSPINVYGASKLAGEHAAMALHNKLLVIRTSWLYAKEGHNFVNSMMRLMKDKATINVVNDQVGSPTYALDLALAILHIIKNYPDPEPGIYHFSNKGNCSWFEFADEIKMLSHSACTVLPIPSTAYPTAAKRPAFSVLNTEKIQQTFQISISDWKDALQRCLFEKSSGTSSKI